MKLDLTRLPVAEAVIGFLVLSLIATFVLAFTVVEPFKEEEAVVETQTPGNGETPPPGGLAVSMGDNFFDPEELTVPAGETVTIAITNDGAVIHNMRIAGPDGEYDTDDDAVSDPDVMRAGQEGTIEFTAPAEAGEIDFRCDFHPTEMVGKIIVQ